MKINKIIILIVATFFLTGCSSQTAATQLNATNMSATNETSTTAADTEIAGTETAGTETVGTEALDTTDTEATVMEETVPKTTEVEDTAINSDSLLATDTDIIYITEKMFIAQTNDVYINTDDYMGKTLQYEGFVMSFFDEATQKTYYYVIRYGPGCCGYDANAGFEIITKDGEYPADNEWVQVTGVLGTYAEGEYKYLYLDVTDLQVLEERGAESVTQ